MLEYAAFLDPKCKPTAVVKKGAAPGAGKGGAAKEASWRDLPVHKRLEHALIKVCEGGQGESISLRMGIACTISASSSSVTRKHIERAFSVFAQRFAPFHHSTLRRALTSLPWWTRRSAAWTPSTPGRSWSSRAPSWTA